MHFRPPNNEMKFALGIKEPYPMVKLGGGGGSIKFLVRKKSNLEDMGFPNLVNHKSVLEMFSDVEIHFYGCGGSADRRVACDCVRGRPPREGAVNANKKVILTQFFNLTY